MGAVAGSALSPPLRPDTLWEELQAYAPRKGNLFVLGHVQAATLTCGDTAPCSIDLGLYVDGDPVGHTNQRLSSDCSSQPCKIHVPEQDLFGIAPEAAAGAHTVQLCSRTRTGKITSFSHEAGEIGAILLGS
jgi:hypothetical protein